ncbi:MAG: C40 family peptidase [Desulfobulbaceae bacterium]|nr:C40 family peptidase [Desulfobulbaceae bacterium]
MRCSEKYFSPKICSFHSCFLGMILLLLAGGCSTHTGKGTGGAPTLSRPPVKTLTPRARKSIPRLGYTIQVGAFSRVENAAGLTEKLTKKGLTAYYFRHNSGLYKVRFGNFSSQEDARRKARKLLNDAIIADFYIVRPESYITAHKGGLGLLRQELTVTAADFLGIPYKWGGTSTAQGFDCSGLTMAVYRLNGLNLPRTSRSQFQVGRPVAKEELQKGDLVFFATNGGRKVSHVGIYTGNNTFIHAPRTGKRIQTTSLSNSYFQKRFIGARTYL